jgi:EAL domain-containing protein (putative c-di-GMP-specific phosphodiesterase class I)
VRVAIDDFGTGYSSLAYLRQLPIDKLKIDRSFLRELDAHPHDAAIVQAIAAMAKALGLRVAAEGVETEAQLARLRALGCDEWQGHHFSASMDAAGFEKLLQREFKEHQKAG